MQITYPSFGSYRRTGQAWQARAGAEVERQLEQLSRLPKVQQNLVSQVIRLDVGASQPITDKPQRQSPLSERAFLLADGLTTPSPSIQHL
ncbi:MAG TPA: hypothetical protein VIT22_12945 [Pseudoxanthomonas sp.]